MKNGFTLELLYRCSSMERLVKVIEKQPNFFGKGEVLLIPYGYDDKELEETPAAIAANDKLKLIIEKKSFLKCLHCGEPISTDGSLMVEIDALGLSYDAGMIHVVCRVPSDRVIGEIQSPVFKEYSYLQNFDFERWFAKIQNGQSGIPQNRVSGMIMTWSGRNVSALPKKFCVAAELKNGELRYVTHRNKLSVFDQDEAAINAESFSSKLQFAKHDPWCYSSITGAYGMRSALRKMLGYNEQYIEIVKFIPRPITNDIRLMYSDAKSFYAPLCFLREINTDMPMSSDGSHLYFLIP